MKKLLIAMFLVSTLVTNTALATGGYGGLSMGLLDVGDTETGNLGIQLGSFNEHGVGFEFLYAFTILDDDQTANGVDLSAETDIVSLFAVYKTQGPVYLKVKAGYGLVSLKFDIENLGSVDDSTEGWAYGISGGMTIDKGSLELSYYRFPDFEEFNGVSTGDDDEVQFINLSFIWSF